MDISNIRCKKCKYYRNVYIHPWSVGVTEELKGSHNAFACLLPNDEDFVKSFNKEIPRLKDLRVDVHIGTDDSIGCECFTEVENDRDVG